MRGAQHQPPLGGLGGGAQQQVRVSPGVGAPVEDHLAAGDGDTGRDPLQLGGAAPAGLRRAREHGVDALPGQPGQVGDAPADLADLPLGGLGVGEAEARGEVRPESRGRPGRWPGPATSCSTSRTSSSCSRLGSRSACETSTSQVATSALRTVASRSPPTDSLRSGTDGVGQLADPVARGG